MTCKCLCMELLMYTVLLQMPLFAFADVQLQTNVDVLVHCKDVANAASVSKAAPLLQGQIDSDRKASIWHSYEFLETRDTPPPCGFKPFYISHYGRHGSRRLMEPIAADVTKALESAAEINALTDDGARLLSALRRLKSEHDGMLGQLTERGAVEQRTLAKRMVARFPNVFASGRIVSCKSSTIPRCIQSMANFSIGLKESAPSVDIRFSTGEKILEKILRLPDDWGDIVRKSQELALDMERKDIDTQRLRSRFFMDCPQRKEIVPDDAVFCRNLFKCASICQCLSAELGGMNLYGFFANGELTAFSHSIEAEHYGMMGNSAEFGTSLVREARALLQDVVEHADIAVSGGNVAADLRFGHDAGLWPLAALMGISGAGDCVSVHDVHRRSPVWRFMSMASNLQMVFYRNDGGDVIVKVLYNEQETTIQGMLAKGPYYRWGELRRHFIDAVAE